MIPICEHSLKAEEIVEKFISRAGDIDALEMLRIDIDNELCSSYHNGFMTATERLIK